MADQEFNPSEFEKRTHDDVSMMDTSEREAYEEGLQKYNSAVGVKPDERETPPRENTIESSVDDSDIDFSPDDSEEVSDDQGEGIAEESEESAEEVEPEDTSANQDKKPRVQKRIDQLTKARREAERQLEQTEYALETSLKAQRELEERNQQLMNAYQKIGEQKPHRDDYESDAEYTDAAMEYAGKVAEITAEKRTIEREAHRAQMSAREVIQNQRASNVKRAMEKYPDFNKVVASVKPTDVRPDFSDILHSQPDFAELAYHLGKNPEEAKRIGNLPPHRMGVELGVLTANLRKLDENRKIETKAPSPITPIKGKNKGLQKNPSEMSTAEYIKWANKKEFGGGN